MASGAPSKLVFYVNGRRIEELNPDPEMTLLFYIRSKLRLTGSKLGCSEGGCGACTVMVSGYNRSLGKISHISVNACLAPLCSVHGLAVTTVEGIGGTRPGRTPHPVQERLAKSFGSQCGFCTPGIVMSMYTLLRNEALPCQTQIEEAFEGNLCRCTGYRPILEGFRTFSKEFQCGMGEKCCKNAKPSADESTSPEEESKLKLKPFDPSQEPIFPPELQLSDAFDKESLVFSSSRVTWYRPTSLNELIELKEKYPDAKIINGNTEVGIEMKFKKQNYPVLICASHIPELHEIDMEKNGVRFGASVSLTKIDQVLKQAIKDNTSNSYKNRVFEAVVEMLRWFAGQQVRNVAAVGGNIMTASPISDLNPIFVAAGCELTVTSKENGKRVVIMDKDFFQGYRQIAIKNNEILLDITIPFTEPTEFFFAYKQAHRRDDDIAIVNGAFKVAFAAAPTSSSATVQSAVFAFGGMAPFTKLAPKAMEYLVGKQWFDDGLVQYVCEKLLEDLPLPPGTPGGMEPYRTTLALSFFYKFFVSVTQALDSQKIPSAERSITETYHRPNSHGVQVLGEVPSGQLEKDAVGRPLVHTSALKQTTGEAVYCDDIPEIEGELYLALVTATISCGEILEIDWADALAMPGVVDKVDASDVPGSNMTGTAVKDDEIFATKAVSCMGQVIGAIVARTQIEAQRAVQKVKVLYNEKPPIITIKQAIEAKSFFDYKPKIEQGNVAESFAACDKILEGEFRMGGQEHFYLECQVTLARPSGEDGEMEIISSTQAPTASQFNVAEALGVPANRITSRVKRLGGGFGGKESRFWIVTLPVAVAANKLNRPVRCSLDRDEDMVSTGTRHPFYTKYKVGYNNDGRIVALEANLYSNCGNSLDLSLSVMERAVFSIDNCYNIPNMKISGLMCKTNISSNTAFRGFGGPQGMMVMESLISEIAIKLQKPAEKIREINFYKEGEKTHFNQVLEGWFVPRCWDEVLKMSDYYGSLQKSVSEFNKANRWKKRGLAAIPTKFGISFTAAFLNQAGALVHIYKDGSVFVSHCGVEMGQGLHTKMIQVASRVLDVSVEKIHIAETSTQHVPNSSPTAASAGSDLNGMAVLNACQQLADRLKPFRENPARNWEDAVDAAYFARVNLSANGFYRTPDLGYNFKTNSGRPFNYFTQGAGVSLVEIDCLTGDHTVLRTDIVMDVGTSLNPAIDVGQIEGGFVQGYGLVTLEEQRYSPKGFLFTRGPGFYKIPGFADIPVEFNVTLLKGATNPKAVYSSKAIGEPPLFLASTVFFAIKEAVREARQEVGLPVDSVFAFDSPATAERIRMACQDQFTQKPAEYTNDKKPWFVRLDD